MKKIIAFLMCCCLLFTTFGISAEAANVKTKDELKAVLADIAADFHATNGTTKQDVLDYVQSTLPTASVWATNGNYSFKIRLATEKMAGFVSMGIGVTLDGVTVEPYIFRQDIAALSKSADATNIEADKTAMEKVIKGLTCTNKTTKEDILKAVKAAATHGTSVVWGNDFVKKEATDTSVGNISGTLKLSLGSETRNIAFVKIISMDAIGVGKENDLMEDRSAIKSALYAVNLTNQSTKKKLLNTALAAATHGSSAEWKSFSVKKATFDAAGKLSGELIITLNGESLSLKFSNTIPKLAARKMPSEISVNKQEWEILRLTNIERYNNGQKILTMTGTLQDSANIREPEVVTKFSHTRPNGKSCFSVFDSKYKHLRKAENLGRYLNTPAETVKAWMKSKGHRANILTAAHDYLGVGYTKDSLRRSYWVQMFVDDAASIVSVTTSTGSTTFANVDEMQREYFICKDSNGMVSYAPIDITTMTKKGKTYTATGLRTKNPIVLKVKSN